MKSIIEIKERENGAHIEIIMPSGTIYKVSFDDRMNMIVVNVPDGGLLVKPSAANEVKIYNEESLLDNPDGKGSRKLTEKLFELNRKQIYGDTKH